MLKTPTPSPMTELDEQVYERIVPPDHYLRLVQRHIDFERLRPRLAQAYSGTGRPGIDPVRMFRILFLCYHYKLSDRQVMTRAQTDMAFRWFLQLNMYDTLPNHTSDTYFRQRFGEDGFQHLFQEIVAQAREHGLVKDRLRLKDATHIHALAADARPLALAAQVRERLLHAAQPLFGEWVAEQRTRLETLRQTTAEFSEDPRLAARIEFLSELAEQLRQRVADRPAADTDDSNRLAWKRLDKALALVAKLLADRADPAAGDRLASGSDPDARTGRHGDFFLGYLLDVAVDSDSEIITAVNVLPANGAEAADAAALIRSEERAHGNDVEGLSIDGVGFNGPVLRELTDPNGLNLEVIVPPPAAPPQPTFGPERFILTVIDANVGELTCPHGETTRRREQHKHGYRYTFAAGQCANCPLRKDCLQNPRSSRGRTVIKNEYDAEYGRVKAKAAMPEYAAVRREHSKIERKLGELARHHDNRRARYRGVANTLVQSLITAVVVNVKRIVKLLEVKKMGMLDSELPVRAELAAG